MSSSDPINLSIIIPHHNNYTIIKECLLSLLAVNIENSEIIIVDNNSKDNSYEQLSSEFKDKIILLKSEINLGYAGGCNLGATKAKGKFLLFLSASISV